jgi:hypothetical protein
MKSDAETYHNNLQFVLFKCGLVPKHPVNLFFEEIYSRLCRVADSFRFDDLATMDIRQSPKCKSKLTNLSDLNNIYSAPPLYLYQKPDNPMRIKTEAQLKKERIGNHRKTEDVVRKRLDFGSGSGNTMSNLTVSGTCPRCNEVCSYGNGNPCICEVD